MTLMIHMISNMSMTSASTKNKSSIVRKGFDILHNLLDIIINIIIIII